MSLREAKATKQSEADGNRKILILARVTMVKYFHYEWEHSHERFEIAAPPDPDFTGQVNRDGSQRQNENDVLF